MKFRRAPVVIATFKMHVRGLAARKRVNIYMCAWFFIRVGGRLGRGSSDKFDAFVNLRNKS